MAVLVHSDDENLFPNPKLAKPTAMQCLRQGKQWWDLPQGPHCWTAAIKVETVQFASLH